MEESDAMLLANLKEYVPIPEQISSLKAIRTQHIYSLTCAVFELLKIDHADLKQASKAQRFRSMTRLTQAINQELDSAFDLNDIMNPTPGFLRKLLLGFVGKLTAIEGDRNRAVVVSDAASESRYRKEVMKRWVAEQWVCPELRTRSKVNYRPYLQRVDLKKEIFKRNIVPELGAVPGNACAILRNAIARNNMETRKREAEEGITRKQNEQNDRNVHRIVKNNAEDWSKVEASVKKLKKNLMKETTTNQAESEPAKEILTVYQQEVTKITEQNKKFKVADDKKTEAHSESIQSLEEDLNPLQRIKRECENTRLNLSRQLEILLQKIADAKLEIEDKQLVKQQLQEQITNNEERAVTQKQERAGLKKQAEKQKIILETLEGETDINKEVKELREEVKYLESEANKQIKGLEDEIENTKKQGEQKIQIIKDLKMRLSKIEADYAKVCEEIEEKTEIKGKIKVSKSGISRLYYSKKISEMEVRWREAQKESKKITDNVNKLRQDVNKSIKYAEIVQNQIDNLSNASKLRSEAENTSFKEMFGQCKKTFSRTIKCIQEINQIKNEIQEYEMKVHTLSGKDYKENTKKLQATLEELQKQLRQMNSKK